MKRNFTSDELTELCYYLPTDNGSFWDSINDLGLATSRFFGFLDIDSDMDNINNYHKKIMNRYDTTKSELTKIFENVRNLDDDYQVKASESKDIVFSFKNSIDKMAEIMSNQPNLINSLETTLLFQMVKDNGNKLIAKLGDEILDRCNDPSDLTDAEKKILEKYLNNILNGTTDVTSLSVDEKDKIIKLYEMLHVECAAMNSFLGPLEKEGYDDDIREIKLLTYTAEEPYRTVFLENADKMKIIELHYDPKKSQCYNSGDEGIYFTIEKWKGDYTTFFHESAHNIDDLLADGKNKYYTLTYTDQNGNTLMSTARQDVITYVETKIDVYMPICMNIQGVTLAEMEIAKEEVLNLIMNCPDIAVYAPTFSRPEIQTCYNAVIKSIINSSTVSSHASSDVYGGFTGNLLRNNLGHLVVSELSDGTKTGYWINGAYDSVNDTIIPTYEDGSFSYTGKQAKELWAENYAAQMTKNTQEISEISNHFNGANDMIEIMMEEEFE